MTRPTLEQVDAYIQNRRSKVDAIQFWNFYESKGWKVGNQPMKNWHAAIATWERRERPNFKQQAIACRLCMDGGVLPETRMPCSCIRGREAQQARIVMAKVRQLSQQMRIL